MKIVKAQKFSCCSRTLKAKTVQEEKSAYHIDITDTKKQKTTKQKAKKKTRKRQTKNDPEVYSQVGKILQRETELKRDSEKWKGIQFFAHLTKWRV